MDGIGAEELLAAFLQFFGRLELNLLWFISPASDMLFCSFHRGILAPCILQNIQKTMHKKLIRVRRNRHFSGLLQCRQGFCRFSVLEFLLPFDWFFLSKSNSKLISKPSWTDLERFVLIGTLDQIEILIQLGLCFLLN